MGKHNPPKGAKLLYRRSNCTLQTRSKTCSGASQFLTKSAVLLLKNKIPKNNYYMDNGKLKRDLSIETDVCILRGYYKKKFNRFKYSISKTDVRTAAKSNIGNSYGDSIPEEYDGKCMHIDVTSLVVENLKELLNNWIKKYMLDNKETKQKIEIVLDSILHKLQRYSSCTYTLDIKVDEEKILNSNDVKEKSSKLLSVKPSCQTVPVMGRNVRLISTLSIPRKIKRHTYDDKSEHNKHNRKIRFKNVFLTVSRSSTFLLNSSSFNLLTISTRSFMKRCATYDGKEIKTSDLKHREVMLPKSSYSETIPDTIISDAKTAEFKPKVECKIYPNDLGVEPVQSLVKSIYADDPANVTSTELNLRKCKQDNYTMTDTDSAPKCLTFSNQHCKLNWNRRKFSTKHRNMTIDNTTKGVVKVETKSTTYAKLKKIQRRYKTKKTSSKDNKKYKYRSGLKKVSNSGRKENNFAKDLQKVLNYFSSYTDNKNMKFDIKINVYPQIASKTLDKTKDEQIKNNTLNDSDENYTIPMPTQILPDRKEIINNVSRDSQKSEPKFISILDSTASQCKYVISKGTSSKIIEINGKENNNKDSSDSNDNKPGIEIAKDINELRGIIKDLTITTEKFVKENLTYFKMSKQQMFSKHKGSKVCTSYKPRINDDSKILSLSKAVQFSNGENKSQIMSGLKLKKEPKKKYTQETNECMAKKSNSYNIIESESILNVTDMTTAAAETSKNILIDKALNCSLPKSKSQLEITVGQSQRKLLAYFCDEFHSNNYTQNQNACRYTGCSKEKTKPKCNKETENANNEVRSLHEEDCEICVPGCSGSSIYIDLKDQKKFTVRSRSGMSFWEGLIYCILLWIPVIVILWLIYVYVIKDIIEPKNPAIGRTALSSDRPKNTSFFRITLSDLGF